MRDGGENTLDLYPPQQKLFRDRQRFTCHTRGEKIKRCASRYCIRRNPLTLRQKPGAEFMVFVRDNQHRLRQTIFLHHCFAERDILLCIRGFRFQINPGGLYPFAIKPSRIAAASEMPSPAPCPPEATTDRDGCSRRYSAARSIRACKSALGTVPLTLLPSTTTVPDGSCGGARSAPTVMQAKREKVYTTDRIKTDNITFGIHFFCFFAVQAVNRGHTCAPTARMAPAASPTHVPRLHTPAKTGRQQEQRTQHQSGKKKNTSHMVSHNTPLSVQRTCAEMMFCTVYQKILNRV